MQETLEQAFDFLKAILPWDGMAFGNLHWTTSNLRDDGKPFWGSRAGLTPEDLMSSLRWAARQDTTRDIYFCTSSQAVADEKTAKTGRKYHYAVRSQRNAVALRSLFVDIDVKEGAYASTDEAIASLVKFMADVGLPEPTFAVASGSGGLHVYWAFAKALPLAEWQPLANALAAAVREHGLHADTQCTIDSARILRVPGTTNWKGGQQRPVELLMAGAPVDLEVIKAALAPFAGKATPSVTGALLPRGPGGDNAELAAGLVREVVPIPIEDVAKQCGFIRNALTDGGATYPNPLWMQTVFLSTFTVEGADAAHRMSKGHRSYTFEETQAEYERQITKRETRDLGWTSCDKIEANGCTACAVCAHKGKGKSPLHFATPERPKPKDALPDGYVRGPKGEICKLVIDDTGATMPVVICHYPLSDAWLQDNPWALHCTTITTTGRKTKVELPLENIATKDALVKAFAKYGLMFSETRVKHLREFLVSWIQQLQQQKDAVVSSSPFGWSVDRGKVQGFTYAGKVWMENGAERLAAMPDNVTQIVYSPRGEIKPWLDAARVITDQNRPDLQIPLAISFGAPLMRFTGEEGALVHLYSPESGIGKSTAMKAAQAVWGHSKRAMQSLTDTKNSVVNKMGVLKALPLFWDEMKTDAETKKFGELVFQITQGTESARLRADITQRERGEWQTLLASASNASVLDTITAGNRGGTNAGIFRVMELKVIPPAVKLQPDNNVSRMFNELQENYGHAGLAYARFIGSEHKRIASEVATLHDALSRELGAEQDERFWFASIAVMLAGAAYAKDLGLVEFDLLALKARLVRVLNNMRREIKHGTNYDLTKAESIVSVIGNFLADTRTRHTIVTNRINVARGKPPKGQYVIENDLSKLEAVYVQRGREDNLVRISSTYFSKWCHDQGYSRHTLLKTLRENYGVKEITNGILGSGTDRSTGVSQYLIEINLDDPAFAGLVE